MATLTVTTAADVLDATDGVLSLREAVLQANDTAAADTIVFAGALEGRALTLTFGQLELTGDVTIDGDRDDNGSRVTIDGNRHDRVLEIAGGGYGTDARLADLAITAGYGYGESGGGILLGAGNSLTLAGCTVRGNETRDGSGGGVFADEGSRLTVVRSTIEDNSTTLGNGGGIAAAAGAQVVVTDSRVLDNSGYWGGGGIFLAEDASLLLTRSWVSGNRSYGEQANGGGGIFASGARVAVVASTLSGNIGLEYGPVGGGIYASDSVVSLSRSTIAGNRGGGILARYGNVVDLDACTVTGNRDGGISSGRYSGRYGNELQLADTIVAGNFGFNSRGDSRPADIGGGAITASNGHNIFGSDVAGAVAGDLENVAAARLFAALDPETGGGRLALNGGPTPTVRLRDALDNPALSGADPLDAGATDQRDALRPLPRHSNPDIGAFELDQRHLSTSPSAHNDVLTGTVRADTLVALAGNDLVRGLGGDDDLRGVGGSDTLDGGGGRDRLAGGAARDLLFGEGGNDRLFGGFNVDALFAGPGDDLLRGQGGADRLRGEGGRDVFDLDPGDTGVGADRRDLILDFTHGADRIDVASIDANAGQAGDQAFRLLGDAPLTGTGQLRFGFLGTSTLVQGSTDRDRAPEFELELAGTVALGAEDFLL
jgi:hypothetical protein